MYEYSAKIIKVVDGDTVDVDIDLGFDIVLSGQRVRVFGIDTPESRTTDKVEKHYGLLAKKFVKETLKVGATYTLLSKKDEDGDNIKGKFGRILGDFKIGDKTLTELLIENHHAVAYHGQSKEDVREQHLKNRELLDKQGE